MDNMSQILNLKLSSDYIIEPPRGQKTPYQWINFGEDNLFPQFLQNLTLNSATHSSIVNSKSKMTLGEGLNLTPEVENYILTLTDDDINELIYKMALDLIIYGGYALGIIWTRDRKTIAKIYHVDFSTVRSGKIDSETHRVEKYYVSQDWSNFTLAENQPIEFQSFSQSKNKEYPEQILYYKRYQSGFYYYPIPDYMGGVGYIDLDSNIQNYHIQSIKNGLMPSMLIEIFGTPTQEEAQAIKDKIQKSFVGSNNGGKFFLTFYADENKRTNLTPIEQNNNHELLASLNEIVTQQILTAHRLTSPTLAGIPGGGSLGGDGNEILIASELYYQTVIADYQKEILKSLDKILKINGYSGEKLTILNSQPVKFRLSESVLSNILTQNELREMIGYQPIETQTEASKIEMKNFDNSDFTKGEIV